MSAPSISERRYVRVIPGAAEEPTSTLVLTSHTSHYVDIRIFKSQNDEGPELPNDGGPMERLEWGFAGTSHTEQPVPEPAKVKPSRSVWQHWVDSKSDDPKPDEGDMWPQPNGDTLEKGSTRDPETGAVTEYEELWADVPVEKTGNDGGLVSIVLQLHDDARSSRGMVVRVGRWCQGLLKIGNEVTVERWRWVSRDSILLKQGPTKTGENETPVVVDGSTSTTSGTQNIQDDGDDAGDWKRVARLGVRFLPCAVTFDPELAKEGNVVEAGDSSWKVIENYQW
ncbi:MAG: hypothetical protein M1830_005582 [Pleopsidium flavum]|nr:MAG: hypothetical protein M1830_005582 [Pleopsidium flavum]